MSGYSKAWSGKIPVYINKVRIQLINLWYLRWVLVELTHTCRFKIVQCPSRNQINSTLSSVNLFTNCMYLYRHLHYTELILPLIEIDSCPNLLTGDVLISTIKLKLLLCNYAVEYKVGECKYLSRLFLTWCASMTTLGQLSKSIMVMRRRYIT